MASELFDLGEDVPVTAQDTSRENPPARNEAMRKQYPSRLDALIRALDIPPQAFAERVSISRRQLARLRGGEANAFIWTVRQIVIALRQQGHDVVASDIADVGEDEVRE
jgi:predicted transcriptional regulator